MVHGFELPSEAILRVRHLHNSCNEGKKPDYYKVLDVGSRSSIKDIRKAYMRLCQIHHPDKGGCATKFAQLQEAYEVLSKTSSRYAYDASTHSTFKSSGPRSTSSENSKFYYRPEGRFTFENPYRDARYSRPNERFNRERKSDYGSMNYYGIKGIRRQPNSVVVLLCIGLCMIGSTFHYITVKTHSQQIRKALYERSARSTAYYNDIKQKSSKLDREGNLKRIFGEDAMTCRELKDGNENHD
ncbi:dnaJ homolog subfamily C member 4-like isoform X1 [Varroa jacobsoni]|uniref:dnaJ homolog subfamily C member 4-like isoform X1 n=1 Tax=Varroa jacobsoni TaxID=62625 RepID=UPI000BF47187|nr:dnaJ homolog subfamily C member 4-like isoform X1 [Varroa jacobsoni]XP_022705494.1 dnaJ homolog subfamily C member 4-like isoform X1 [Varroa jacobsoni]XP_022705495.1 dnaJ homolog subfamily C member 4-like isoform X1 [Varroa jacobsoni]